MERRPLRPFSRSKMGRSRRAALGDLFDDAPGEFVLSELGSAAASSRMRGFQTASSCFSTATAMEGLQVAPTAPCSME
jgi:hypothetical protein